MKRCEEKYNKQTESRFNRVKMAKNAWIFYRPAKLKRKNDCEYESLPECELQDFKCIYYICPALNLKLKYERHCEKPDPLKFQQTSVVHRRFFMLVTPRSHILRSKADTCWLMFSCSLLWPLEMRWHHNRKLFQMKKSLCKGQNQGSFSICKSPICMSAG